MDSCESTEFVVALREQRVMWSIKCQTCGARLGDELVRILRKERELRARWAGRYRGKREQVNAPFGELGQDAVRRSQFVADVGVVVLDAADRECQIGLLASGSS